MQALEIRHLRRVAGLDKGLVAGLDQLDQATAKNGLLTEQVGLALFLEGGLDDARAATADSRSIGKADLVGVAGRVLMNGEEAGNTAAANIFSADSVARALGRDHQAVDVAARLDQVEVDVQAVREGNGGAGTNVGGYLVAINIGLQLVRGQHHDHVAPCGSFGNIHHLEACIGRLGAAGGVGTKRDGDFCDTAVLKVGGMGVALAAIADDDDLFFLDQADIGVTIVIDSHGLGSPS